MKTKKNKVGKQRTDITAVQQPCSILSCEAEYKTYLSVH